MLKGINSMKLNNKSSNVVQVNNGISVTSNSATYVKLGVASHAQYNSEVSMLNYLKDTKYQKYTIYNHILYGVIDETLVKSTFEVIGEEPIIGHCITTQDLINIYAHGCIQGFYEEYCKLHTDKENLILAKVLSILGIEVWKDVTCYGAIYKGLYMVSNLGRVKRLFKNHVGKILKPYDCGKQGYLYVALFHKCKRQNVRVNRLVGLTFYGESNEPLEACHSNTNSYDNRLFNLEFKTHYENIMNPLTQRKRNDTLKSKKAKADKAESAASTLE